MQQIDIGAAAATVSINQSTTLNSPSLGSTGFTLPTVESNFVLQSRIAYSALRNQLEFS